MPKNIVKILLIIPAIAILLVGYLVLKPQEAPQQAIAVEQTETPVVEEKPVEQPKKWTAEELLTLTNTERAKVGAKTLTNDARLNQSANFKLEEMLQEDNFDHSSLTGKHGYEYVFEQMPECLIASENITRNYLRKNPILGFEGSPSHWEAILDNKYEYVGFATGESYFVIHFCDLDG